MGLGKRSSVQKPFTEALNLQLLPGVIYCSSSTWFPLCGISSEAFNMC